MANDQAPAGPQNYMPDPTLKIRDLEDKNRTLKNQVLLMGKNLVELKEKTTKDMIEIKKSIQTIKDNMDRLISFLSTASDEFQKFARKDDVEILAKQVKMFEPFAKKI